MKIIGWNSVSSFWKIVIGYYLCNFCIEWKRLQLSLLLTSPYFQILFIIASVSAMDPLEVNARKPLVDDDNYDSAASMRLRRSRFATHRPLPPPKTTLAAVLMLLVGLVCPQQFRQSFLHLCC